MQIKPSLGLKMTLIVVLDMPINNVSELKIR